MVTRRCSPHHSKWSCAFIVTAIVVACVLAVVLLTTLGVIFLKRSRSIKNKGLAVTWCAVGGTCFIDTSNLDLQSENLSFVVTETGHKLECNRFDSIVRRSWHGVCNGGGNANILTRTKKNATGENLVFGSIVDVDNAVIYQIFPDAFGNNRVIGKPAATFPPEDEDPTPAADDHSVALNSNTEQPISVQRGTRSTSNTCDDNGRIIDIMVVWTKEAECRQSLLREGCRRTALTEENMRGWVDTAIEETNQAFRASGINAELRLVHAYCDHAYVEAPDEKALNIALSQLKNNFDGKLDDIHNKRKEVRDYLPLFITLTSVT